MVGGSGFQPRFTGAIAVKSSTSPSVVSTGLKNSGSNDSDEANRSHNPKTADSKLQSFFFYLTINGHQQRWPRPLPGAILIPPDLLVIADWPFFWSAAPLTPDTRHLKPYTRRLT